MVYTCEILARGGLFGHVKYVVIKIFFSKGVTLWYTSVKFWGVPQFYTQKHAVQIR